MGARREHLALDQTVQWLTDGHLKYIWWSAEGVEQFFDLDTDPQERHDLANDPGRADEIAVWRSRLVKQLDGREDGHVANGQLLPGQPARSLLPSVIDRWAAGALA